MEVTNPDTGKDGIYRIYVNCREIVKDEYGTTRCGYHAELFVNGDPKTAVK